MSFALHVLPPTAKGDTLDEVTFRFSRTPTALPPALSFQCVFTRASLNKDCEKINVPITIVDNELWEIKIDRITNIDWDAGTYKGAIQSVDETGRVKTYVHLELQVYTTPINQ